MRDFGSVNSHLQIYQNVLSLSTVGGSVFFKATLSISSQSPPFLIYFQRYQSSVCQILNFHIIAYNNHSWGSVIDDLASSVMLMESCLPLHLYLRFLVACMVSFFFDIFKNIERNKLKKLYIIKKSMKRNYIWLNKNMKIPLQAWQPQTLTSVLHFLPTSHHYNNKGPCFSLTTSTC